MISLMYKQYELTQWFIAAPTNLHGTNLLSSVDCQVMTHILLGQLQLKSCESSRVESWAELDVLF